MEHTFHAPSPTLMLNRPRLTKRPSLLDLIQKKNVSYISTFASSSSLFEDDVEPRNVPLPRSPPITPQREDVSEPPPPFALNDDSNRERKETPIANMGPVSFTRRRVGPAPAANRRGGRNRRSSRRSPSSRSRLRARQPMVSLQYPTNLCTLERLLTTYRPSLLRFRVRHRIARLRRLLIILVPSSWPRT